MMQSEVITESDRPMDLENYANCCLSILADVSFVCWLTSYVYIGCCILV